MALLSNRMQLPKSRTGTAWQLHPAQAPGVDIPHLRLPITEMVLVADRLLLPPDLQPDTHSLAGMTLAESPILDFARRVLTEPDLNQAHTEFHRIAERLPGRSATATEWGPDQDCAELTYLVTCLDLGWAQTLDQEPVVLAEVRDGRHVVLSGVRVLAAAIANGRSAWGVQIAPPNEAQALVQQHLGRLHPRPLYRRNLHLVELMGAAPGALDPEATALAHEIATHPLVRRGSLYQPIPFPEFAGLVSQADDRATYRRLGMILDLCDEPRGMRYLDLGCNVGFYTFSMARRGAIAAGLDIDETAVALGRRVAAIKNLTPEFIAAPLEPALFSDDGILGSSRPPWDLVTCFSTLQWAMDGRGDEFAVDLLKSIARRSKALILDVPVNCGRPRLTSRPGWEMSRTAELLQEAGYPHCRHVGTVAPYGVDRRHVFHCWT